MALTEHNDFQDLLGAYALDALDEPEAALVESHLKSCAQCREELASLHDTLAGIAPQDVEYDPAPLWGRIEEAIGAKDDELQGKVIPITSRRRPNPPRLSTAVASVAIVAAFVATGSSVYLSNSRSAVLSSVPKLQSQIIANLQAMPGHRDVTLASTNGKYRISLVVAPSGIGYVTASNLPAAQAAKTYQLWGLKKSAMVSIGIIGTDAARAQFVIPANSTFSELAVSLEPSGGSVAPTSAPIVSGLY